MWAGQRHLVHPVALTRVGGFQSGKYRARTNRINGSPRLS